MPLGICSSTRRPSNARPRRAAQDLAYLEGREQGRPQGIVYGELHRRIAAAEGSPWLRALFEPLQVIAAGAERRFTVTSILVERSRTMSCSFE